MVIRRRCRANAEVSLTASSKPDADFQEFEVRDSAPTPEEVCDPKERFDKMLSAIERLDPKLRNAIRIWTTQECSLEEMAHTLDVSVPAVKARLHQARKSLARIVNNRSGRSDSRRRGNLELAVEQKYA
jgi:RNA polymerase sigma-70 factor (ECF subfamily)